MNNFIKNNEGLLGVLLGLILISYHYVSNGYKFDGYPIGTAILVVGKVFL